jgi:hypothetical protein
MKGRIFKYAKYKAYNVGILTSRVNPRDTSRTCYKCGSSIARYNEGEKPEGYQMGAPLCKCTECTMQGNSDFNGSCQIGNKLFARHGIIFEEKPPTLPATERAEQSAGVVTLQDAKVPGFEPTRLFGMGMRAATGMAPPRTVTRGLALARSRFHRATTRSREPWLRHTCSGPRLSWGVRSCRTASPCGVSLASTWYHFMKGRYFYG